MVQCLLRTRSLQRMREDHYLLVHQAPLPSKLGKSSTLDSAFVCAFKIKSHLEFMQ